MKKAILICALLISLLLPSIALIVYAHPGGTDGRGGHWNRSTGEYHYHHGYSAHAHYDMDGDGAVDCPYDFDDNTEKENKSGTPRTEPPKAKKWSSVLSDILSVVFNVFLEFILPWIIFIIIFIIICR